MPVKFKCGADPEVFLQDAAGAFVSAVGKIGGSKMYPRPLFDLGEGFAVQEDNVAVEYNIPPSDNKQEFVNNIKTITAYLSEQVKLMGLRFSEQSATSFPAWELLSPQSQEFGCDPDFNAWKNGAVNPRPRAADKALRSCGGHVHVGYKFKYKADVIRFIKHMDLYLAVPSVLMDDGVLRKQLYGKRGAFRFKDYGTEYRVLSNFWTFTEERIGWVWDSTEAAMDAWQNNKIDVDSFAEMIADAVDNNNQQTAKFLVKEHNLLVL
jgi:hypothetical protein